MDDNARLLSIFIIQGVVIGWLAHHLMHTTNNILLNSIVGILGLLFTDGHVIAGFIATWAIIFGVRLCLA